MPNQKHTREKKRSAQHKTHQRAGSQKHELSETVSRQRSSNLKQEAQELPNSPAASYALTSEIQDESKLQQEKRPLIKDEQSDTKLAKWRDPITISTVVIAVATLVNLFVSLGMWLTTKDSADVTRNIFNAANRPYVGVSAYTANKDEANKIISINIEYKNIGTVLAKDLEVKWGTSIDGKPSAKAGVPDRPAVIFPQVTAYLLGVISEPAYSAVINGASVLELEVKITYKGITGEEYYTYEKSRYVPEWNRFISISGDAR